jgi:hypothetical protein
MPDDKATLGDQTADLKGFAWSRAVSGLNFPLDNTLQDVPPQGMRCIDTEHQWCRSCLKDGTSP